MPIRRTTGKDIGAAGGSAPRPRRKSEAGASSNRSAAQAATASADWIEPGSAEQSIAGGAGDLKPSADEIERLAYSFWEARGYHGGSPEEDWFRAEQELRERGAVAVAGA